MSDCKKCQDLFSEAFYEELNAEQKKFLENHISICEGCESEYEEMTSALKVMEKRARPEPEQAYWNGYWNKLARRMEDEKTLAPKSKSWWPAFTFVPKWAYQTAAALLLVSLGVFFGRMVFSPPVSDTKQAHRPGLISQQGPGVELASRTQNYIERSKLMLLAIVNFDPETEDSYALNLPYQQQISKELVQEASYLKSKLADSGQRRLENLITDLEVILLQIANLESEYDFEAIDIVKEGVSRRGILMQINLTDIRRSIQKRNKSKSTQQPSNTTQTI
jgi:hypothetical protein